MQNAEESAATHWEVDRRIAGSGISPYCVVVLRNRKRSDQSFVKASSADLSSMNAIADQMQKDLYALGNNEFVEKYNLSLGQ
ncbi:MAG: hypothetical protein KBC96_01750 [Armatimonadetes bacterium]|nr:hypothetical protein [Armatimonadota bacterium]